MSRIHNHDTYGFKLKGEHQQRVAGIHSIGKEYRSNELYRWDGLKRNETGRIVFQFTLDGEGAIRIGEQLFTLKKGQAFLVQIPSDHCYYLPDDSSHWEFIFITLYGQEALRYFSAITEKQGHILDLDTNARPVKHILHLLDKVQTTGIHHAYELSGYAYTFLMECMQYFEHDQNKIEKLPVAIAKTIQFIEQHYQEDLTLTDMVEVSGLSKYHFTRLFHRTVKDTPIKYLTKIRMNHALELLQNKELTIEEVARTLGYTNANYFSKVFKNVLDVNPSEYRNSQSFMPVNQLFLD
ncbi:helix-turn-helix domain-containing protein [Aquibacillus halophilus]|uniref:Helix-turn-helix domain-containing protein n=1 Tax=Aquibacillus halophilus TaxID=930132 RepID=A0A6A8D7K1_9BACI|nr:AraC family transcriptional regulator [Aquibacillus halophilus]MRH41568.1 helix-turn-helix domain-containing protein [Aquibacillus halophilus]